MARVMKHDEAGELWNGYRSRSASYPWEQWLDGETWVLTAGEDFPGTSDDPVGSFRSQIYTTATLRDVMIRTSKLDDTHLAIQCLGRRASGPPRSERLKAAADGRWT